MIAVLLVVVAGWLAAALVAAVLAGRVLHGAGRLADRHERPVDLYRIPRRGLACFETSASLDTFADLANRAVPASAFGAAADRLAF